MVKSRSFWPDRNLDLALFSRFKLEQNGGGQNESLRVYANLLLMFFYQLLVDFT